MTIKTGTIIIPNDAFNAIGNGYIPDIPSLTFLPNMHKLTLLIGLVAIVLLVINDNRSRQKKMDYDFEVLPMNIFILKELFMAALIFGVTWVLAGYNGISWTVVVILVTF